MSSIIDPDTLNFHFQDINTDPQYSAPQVVNIPENTRIPTIDEQTVMQFLVKQKRTASGPDEFPHWFWRDFACYLLFNCSLRSQTVPTIWKLANLAPIPKELH